LSRSPSHCSGLPVARFDADQLAAELGPDWELLRSSTEEHTTPGGGTQPFTWALFRQRGALTPDPPQDEASRH